jgi:hypothetical protein
MDRHGEWSSGSSGSSRWRGAAPKATSRRVLLVFLFPEGISNQKLARIERERPPAVARTCRSLPRGQTAGEVLDRARGPGRRGRRAGGRATTTSGARARVRAVAERPPVRCAAATPNSCARLCPLSGPSRRLPRRPSVDRVHVAAHVADGDTARARGGAYVRFDHFLHTHIVCARV